MIKCCMFDLDGTLLSTLPTITYYVNKTLQKCNISPISEDECKGFVGDGARKLINRVLKSKGEFSCSFEASLCGDYLKNYDTDPYYLTEPYDGITELLAFLRERNIACAVLSNKQESSTKAAISHFFGGSFSAVVGGVDGVPLKPDPTSAIRVLDALGIKPCEVVYIGDTAVDMKTGKNIGAALTVGVLWGFRDRLELESSGAELIISHPRDLIKKLTL